MRISDSQRNAQLLTRLQSNLGEKNKAMDEVATGLRVHRASDDPQAHAAAAKFRAHEARSDSMIRANEQLGASLEHAERLLENGTVVLDEAMRISQQFSSNGYSPEQAGAAADAIAGLRESLLEIANSKFQGAFVFGGTANQSAPYSSTGTFQGATEGNIVEIAPKEFVETPFAEQTFGGQNTIFGVLNDLESALRNQDNNAIQTSFGKLKEARSTMIGQRQNLGEQLGTIEHAQTFLETVHQRSQINAGKAVDADTAASISNLVSISNTLEVFGRTEGKVQDLLDQMLKF